MLDIMNNYQRKGRVFMRPSASIISLESLAAREAQAVEEDDNEHFSQWKGNPQLLDVKVLDDSKRMIIEESKEYAQTSGQVLSENSVSSKDHYVME